MRSVVPIVESSHGEVAPQWRARGWPPPTATTVRAPGSRSAGRCRAGAWASKAAASATPTTAAPALMAIVFRRFVAFEGNSVIVVAGAAWPARAVGGPREMRPGFVRSWYSVLRSLQLPVLAADGADAHALEALRDRVAEEPDRLHGLREEVGVDHLAAPPGVVLVHDREQRFLERPDAVRLRARVALLAVVGRCLDARVLQRSRQARRAHAQAGGGADALVHGHAARVRARRLGQRRVGRQRQRGDERGVVEQAVLRVQDDVRGEAARAEAGQLGGVHHAHRRLVAVHRQRGRLHGVISELALDVVAHRVDGDVLAQVVAGDLHHAVVGAPPRARGGPVAAGDDDAARSRQDVLRPKALGHTRAEGLGAGDANDARAGIQSHALHRLYDAVRRHQGPHYTAFRGRGTTP